MHIPGQGEWKKATVVASPDFHLDTSKIDDVEKLIQRVGWDNALDQINENFEQNPNDEEARRQATLIVKLYDQKVQPLRDRLQH